MRQLDETNDRDRRAGEPVQRKDEAATVESPVPSAGRVQGILASDHEGMKSSMGAAFGTDFSGVQISQDGSAEKLGAQAYTQGDSIQLAAGKGDPSTREGAALLGHELAHVQQQRAGRVDTPQGKGGINGDPALEQEADEAGAAAVRGQPIASHLRGDLGAGAASGGAQAKVEGAPIQAFGSLEHQTYGDDGAKAAGYTGTYRQPTQGEINSGKKSADFHFELTHGDLVMLSGDYFDPRETDEHGRPVADNLFKLAKTPSPAPGQKVGTQDEIMYAVMHANKDDRRFTPQCSEKDPLIGIWSGVKFSDEVKESVNNRYLRLAASNFEHFAAPGGEKTRGPAAGNRKSAGGSYRALHEDAILRAHDAKKQGDSVEEAMAHEAAAEHFLTDGFAAGHLRTPRESIATYWNARYPLFFENFKKTIAQDVAIYINSNEWNRVTVFGSVLDIMGPILEEIDKTTKSLPPVGFDAIVGLLTHDVDNRRGLWVTNDLGMQWQTFGDSHGGVKNPKEAAEVDTRTHVEEAVRLGVTDVQHAYALDPGLDAASVTSQVKAQTPAPAAAGAAKYGAEQMMPFPDASMAAKNGDQEWKQPDFASLWNAPVRSDKASDTYGVEILKSFASGDFGDQVRDMAGKFKPEVPTHGTTIHPHVAYVNAFQKPLLDPSSTQHKIQSIIDYDPGRGQANMRTDDATRADMDRLQQQGRDMAAAHENGPDGRAADENTRLQGLTLEERAHYVRNLESFEGWTTSKGEEDRIVKLFETAPAGDRKPLYRKLEGHDWKGSFKHGWTVTDDDLWDNLSGDRLHRLERLLNSSP